MRSPLRQLGVTSALLVLLAASDVNALNMTLGDVRAQNLGSYGFNATNSVLSFDSGTTDQLYQMYGYLGNANDVLAITGTYFSVASAITQVGPGVATSSLLLNAAGATALGLTAGALRVDYTFTLIDDVSASDWDSVPVGRLRHQPRRDRRRSLPLSVPRPRPQRDGQQRQSRSPTRAGSSSAMRRRPSSSTGAPRMAAAPTTSRSRATRTCGTCWTA